MKIILGVTAIIIIYAITIILVSAFSARENKKHYIQPPNIINKNDNL